MSSIRSAPEGATPGFLVWRPSMKWCVAVDRAVAPLGLTHAQYSLVASLYGMGRAGERPSQRRLADHTGLEALYVSKLARALEAAGLLERARDPRDPRAVQHEDDGTTTIGAVSLTPSQRLLLIALCEPILRGGMVGASQLPSSAAAAARLGWPLTTFNRKLDNVCDKLDREGVQGLRGGVGKLATNRRARLVEHAILSRLVTPQDLDLLEVASTLGEKGTR